jgi:DNA-binding beta-propeller fold protein YncE
MSKTKKGSTMPKVRIASASAQHLSGAGRRLRARALDGTGARTSRVPVLLALAMLCSAALALSLGPASALAETHRGFTGQVGAKGTGAGQMEEPQGVAVNSATGDVYVVDKGNDRIDEFEAGGTFIRAWGWGVKEVGKNEELQTCTVLTGCAPGTAGTGPGRLDAPEGIAVDNSGSASDPSKEDVYVTNTTDNVIEKFSATGEFKGEISTGSGGKAFGGLLGVAVGSNGVLWAYAEKTGKPAGGEEAEIDGYSDAQPNVFSESHKSEAGGDAWPGFAVDGEGNLYVGHRDRRTVGKVSGTGQVIEEEVTGEGSIAVAVDSSDDVYVNVGSVVEELSAATPPAPIETFGSQHPVSGTGIAVSSTTGAVYVSDTASGVVDIFTLGKTPEEAPKTEAASEVTGTTAKLHGELNPGGKSGKLEYQFDYNTGGSCIGGQSVPVPRGEVANAGKAIVEAKATVLEPGATYNYCLVAINPFGATQGNEMSFETSSKAPPAIVSESTSVPIKATEATLQAQINPNKQETTYSFQYATKATGEKLEGTLETVAEVEPPLNGFSPEGQTASVSTGAVLTSNTTYYYRVIAKNASNEEATGKVEHFTTAIPPEVPTGLSAGLVAATTATLNGILNPNSAGNPGSYEFRYAQSPTSCENGEAVGGATLGNTNEAVKSEITGLLPGVQYTFCLRAENEAGEAATSATPVTFTTLAAAPTIEPKSQSVTEVTADSATLGAVVNPGGAETSYRFEYTSEEQFQREGFTGAARAPVPDGQLSPGNEGDLVTAHLQGLLPGTVYHFRVVAENTISKSEGKPATGELGEKGEEIVHTFTTQTAGASTLPDSRVWEQVSPPDKHGSLLEPIIGGQKPGIQAAASGDAIAYLATAPTESSPEGRPQATEVLSIRGMAGASSWGSRDISTPREVASGIAGGEFRFFSPDLSLSIVNPSGVFDPSMSVEASEQTAYLRTDFSGDNPTEPCSSDCYRPLVTGAPGFANVPEGTVFGVSDSNLGETCSAGECGPVFEGASPDGSHVVLRSVAPLTKGAPTGSLYEWANGRLQLVSVLPGGESAPTNNKQPDLGYDSPALGKVVAGTVSADGSRVIWSIGGEGNEHLYVRDMARGETVDLGGTEARFLTASADGSRVLFTAAKGVNVGGDLYAFDAPLGGALSAGHTTDLIPGAGLLGTVFGASQDGSSVYFVSNNVLTGAPNPRGEVAVQGNCRYFGGGIPAQESCDLYHYEAGVTKLVAVLSGEDAPDWNGLGKAYGVMTTTRVSSDGRRLAFMSERPLTGYDNRDASSGKLDEEVFLYDAAGNGGLSCASCDPTGARPHGVLDKEGRQLFDAQDIWISNVASEHWLAGSVPAWSSPLHQSRYLSDSGRLFFNSPDALVPQDTNNVEDVYEYEPPGVGDCSTSSSTFSAASGGCVSLISSGTSNEESVFMDASESGDDVFFLTSAQLSALDVDSVLDLYDARVGGGFPAPAAPPACEGDACQSPAAAPNDPTPGSLTYRGPGNSVAPLTVSKPAKKALKCAKGRKLSHGKCVKSKRKSRKAHRAPKNRRAANKRGAKS